MPGDKSKARADLVEWREILPNYGESKGFCGSKGQLMIARFLTHSPEIGLPVRKSDSPSSNSLGSM